MRPPRCRVCGEEGYGHLCRGVELMQLRERVRAAAERLKPTKELIEKAETRLAEIKPKRKRAPKPRKIVAKKEDGSFDKPAYQREYMRRWRKKKKGKKA